MDTNIH